MNFLSPQLSTLSRQIEYLEGKLPYGSTLNTLALQKYGDFNSNKKSYTSFVQNHEEKTTHQSTPFKPVAVSYQEALVVEQEELP